MPNKNNFIQFTLSLCRGSGVQTMRPAAPKPSRKQAIKRPGGSRCSVLPVADETEHKRVPGSIADEVDLSARKISGTPNGISLSCKRKHLPFVVTRQNRRLPMQACFCRPQHTLAPSLYPPPVALRRVALNRLLWVLSCSVQESAVPGRVRKPQVPEFAYGKEILPLSSQSPFHNKKQSVFALLFSLYFVFLFSRRPLKKSFSIFPQASSITPFSTWG